MEVAVELHGPDLDLILHSSGGSAEAAEAIVLYLRSRFHNIRVIVPNLAMSAATMIACSANGIVMGKHSFLGPTDPQFPLQTPHGVRRVSARAVLDHFERAKRGFADRAESALSQLLVSQYGADLIIHCENAIKLSKMLVNSWLQKYMFADREDRKKLARKISRWLVNHSKFRTHGRHLSRERLEGKSLVIDALENDKMLQDLSLSVFHAATIMFSRFQVGKIVENQHGRSFIKSYSSGRWRLGLILVPLRCVTCAIVRACCGVNCGLVWNRGLLELREPCIILIQLRSANSSGFARPRLCQIRR